MSSSFDDFSKNVLSEFLHLACGELLGEGMSRTTYKYYFDDTKVIKIENDSKHFQNVVEWELWKNNKYCDKVSKWLAPCRYISHSGTFLIMDYARDLLEEEKPRLLPSFVTDIKMQNLGVLNGQVVLRDYGTTFSNLNTRLKKISFGSV